MNTTNPAGISFHSTIIPANSKKPVLLYLNTLKNCEIKSMQNMTVKDCYKKLFNNAKNHNVYRSGVMFDRDENNNIILRILGHSKENDEYIFRRLKKADRDVRYVRDIIDDGYDHEPFEIIC